MANVRITTKSADVQSHIDKAYEYLDKFLPAQYAAQVVEILKQKGVDVTKDIVRNVRLQNPVRLDVLEGLVEFAKREGEQKLDSIKELIK